MIAPLLTSKANSSTVTLAGLLGTDKGEEPDLVSVPPGKELETLEQYSVPTGL